VGVPEDCDAYRHGIRPRPCDKQVFAHASKEFSLMFRCHLVSAGFDAAEGDELGECNVTPVGYAHMTAMLCTLAAGRVLVALEVRSGTYGTINMGLSSVGRIQSRLHLEFRSGCGGDTPWATSSTYKLPFCLGLWHGDDLARGSRAVQFLEIDRRRFLRTESWYAPCAMP
jgi:hypothetical protein